MSERDQSRQYLAKRLVPIVEGFGPEAIPLFIAEFNHADSGNRPDETLIRRYIPALGQPRVDAAEIRYRSFGALSILGRSYPGLVDPFFADQLRTTNRHDSIVWMGNSGHRHFGFLTNLIAGPDVKDAGAAINGLYLMGTNAQAAVPLVFSNLKKRGKTEGKNWWENLVLISEIGRHHEMTVPTLLPILEHTNEHARAWG